jgi:hypothetical protein
MLLGREVLKEGEATLVRIGGRGILGIRIVKAGGTVDEALQQVYKEIARTPEFARAVADYNKAAKLLKLTPAATIEEVVAALGKDVTFSKVGHIRSAIFVPGEHLGKTTYWLQGNPVTRYGERVARHELVHLAVRAIKIIDGSWIKVIDGSLTSGSRLKYRWPLLCSGCYQRCIQGTSTPNARQRSIAA